MPAKPTPTAATVGEAVAEVVLCDGIGDHTVLRWRDGLIPFLQKHQLGTKLYPHPAAGDKVRVTDEMVERAMEAAADACSRHIVCDVIIRAALEAVLAKPQSGEVS